MKCRIGSQVFVDVQIPVLWGKRAILQDASARLSVIDLSGDKARPEIMGDEPADGVEFVPTVDGFAICCSGKEMYRYSPNDKRLVGKAVGLPDCQITEEWIAVGNNRYSGSTVVGSPVGILVTENLVSMGAPLPPGLAELEL